MATLRKLLEARMEGGEFQQNRSLYNYYTAKEKTGSEGRRESL